MLYSPAPMHLPDGFLSLAVSIICWVATVILVGIAISRTDRSLGERQVPLMGIMAAFIFAAQMINFPVAGGTSGHLLGGTLAAILLGPWAAMLVMTAVIRKVFSEKPKEFDPRKYLGPAREELIKMYMDKNEKVVGSAGKA